MAAKKQPAPTLPSTQQIKLRSEYIARQHRKFIASNPKATLKDLRDRLRLAVEQCEWLVEVSDDARIEDWDDIPEPLASELAEWDNSESYCTFDYRLPNQEDVLSEVEELIEEVGPRFRLNRLPKCDLPGNGKGSEPK